MKDFFDRFDTFAIVGVSGNPSSFSRKVFEFLTSQKCTIYPVNPNLKQVAGQDCYKSIDDLPNVKVALFFTQPRVSEELLPACKEKGIDYIWFQQGSADKAVLSKANDLGIQFENSCVYLHHPQSGFPHNFHRFINKTFKIDQ